MRKAKLSQIATLVDGDWIESKDQDPSGSIRLIQLGDIGDGHFINKTRRYITDQTAARLRCTLLQIGDVLLARMPDPIARCCIFPGIGGQKAVTAVDVTIIRSVSDVHASYLTYAINAFGFRRQAESCVGGSTRGRISRGELGRLEVPVPPLEEQIKIAGILGTWDDALEKLDALVAAKDHRKKALMQQLLTGKRRLPKHRAKAWRRLRMSDALRRVFRPVESDQAKMLALVSIRRRCGGLFRRPDVLASEYKTQDLHELRTGDFLISKRQVVHGAWALVESEFKGTLVSKEYAILVNHAPGFLDMRFFAWLSQMPRMLRSARISSTGVHIEKLIFDTDVFLREQISVPATVDEQSAIADVLDTADSEIRVLRAQRAAIGHQKRGLMQRLLTGKVRVNP